MRGPRQTLASGPSRIGTAVALTLMLISGGVMQDEPAAAQAPGGRRAAAAFKHYPGGRAVNGLGAGTPADAAAALRVDGDRNLPSGYRIGGATPSRGRAHGNQVYRFDLEYDGVPLAAPADYVAVVGSNGRLLASRIRNIPVAVDGTRPTSDAATAISIALAHARSALGQSGPLTASDPQLEIWVDSDQKGRLSWFTIVRESGGLDATTAYRIAALEAPAVLSAVNLRQYQSSIRVQSDVWQLSPNLPTVSAVLSDAQVASDSGTVLSDEGGLAHFPSLAPGSNAFARLRGPFAVVNNAAGLGMIGMVTTTGSNDVLDFGADTEFELAQTTAFRWVTFTNRWVRHYLPSLNTRTSNLDELAVRTNSTGVECNAFAALGLIVFGRASSGCNNTASPTIVVHEFGHEVHGAFFQDAFDGAYSEGFGDALAALVTGQPCLGPGFFVSSEQCLRDTAAITTYPVASTDTHERGRPYAQFAWVLATTLGIDTAAQLVLGAAAAAPIDIADAVHLSFVTDDDDGLLGTCSAHQKVLEAAADSRLLPRPPDCRPAGDNRVPTARDDSFSITEDAAGATVNLTANDSDPDGDALIVASIQQGGLGVLSCTAAGCAYTPNPNANGTDTLSYTAIDTYGGSATATVRIIIAPVDDAPSVTGPGDRSGGEDEAIPLAASVVDPDGPAFTLQWIAREGLRPAPCTFSNAAAAITTVTCSRDGAFEVALLVQQGTQQITGPIGHIVIANTRPSVAITAPVAGASFPDTHAVQLLSTFEEGPTAGTHSCEIAWGDGSTTPGTVDVGTCSGSHTYGANGSGSRQITVSVTDPAGVRGAASVTITISSTAAVCAGGSGQACATAGAGMIDTVRFRLAARQVGTARPGHLELKEGKAWRFEATAITAFSVNGTTAAFSGEGMLDGRVGYRFEASVQDNRRLSLPDRVTIVIRDSGGALARIIDGSVSHGQIVVN